MPDLSSTDKLLEALLATDDPADKAALVAESVLNGLSEIEATIARRCIILRWFDKAIVEALLIDRIANQGDHSHIEQSSAIYTTLAELPFVEHVTPWGLTYHALTREGLLKRYSNSNPEPFLVGCRLAAPVYAKRVDNETIANEALFCYIVAGEQEQALDLLETLLVEASHRENWQSFPTILQTQDEAEELPFVRPLPRSEHHWLIRALVNFEQGNIEATIECYEYVLRLNPTDQIIAMNKARALAALKKLKLAIPKGEPELATKTLSHINTEIKQTLKTLTKSQAIVKPEWIIKALEEINTQAKRALQHSSRLQNPQYRLEKDLIQRLKRGDEDAWVYFTQAYGTRLFNYLRHHLPSYQDIEDVVVDTMSAVVRAIMTFDGNVTLITFLLTIAKNKLVDFYRRQPKTSELLDTMVDAGSNTESIEFHGVFNTVRKEYREILLMRYQLDLSVQEIADFLELSYKAAESSLSRAKQELREALDISTSEEVEYAYETLIVEILNIEISKDKRLRIYEPIKLIREIQNILSELNERNKRILELRFGLNNGIKLTQREVGENFGLTGSRIGQIERDLLEELRKPMYLERLKPYLSAPKEIPMEQKELIQRSVVGEKMEAA